MKQLLLTNKKHVFVMIILLLGPSVIFAAPVDASEQLQQDSTNHLSVVTQSDPQLIWDNHLDQQGLEEGHNKKNGRQFFIASGSALVGKERTDSGFIDSRTIAYNKAVLHAKSSISEFFSSEIGSERNLQVLEQGGESSGEFKDIAEELSIMSKVQTLTHEKLDHEIEKYDPDWDGTGVPREEKEKKIIEQREIFVQNVAQNSKLYIQGASPIFNAEGPTTEGYSVVVGLVWSPRLNLVSEAMLNPSIQLEPGTPASSIRQQIKDKLKNDPNFLAATMGVRIWRNEKGERTLVSFASAKGKGSPIIMKKKSEMRARAQMTQFIAEDVVSKGILDEIEVLDYHDDDTMQAYNESDVEMNIKAVSKKINLTGAGSVYYWKGKHPNAGKMAVSVLSWSPTTQNSVVQMKKETEKLIEKAQKPQSSDSPQNSSYLPNPAGLTGGQTEPTEF